MSEIEVMEIIKAWISIPYALAFIFLSYGIFKKLNIKFIVLNLFKKEVNIPKTWLVCIFAFIVAIPFYFLEEGTSNIIITKLIITYAISTSFYELIIKQIDKFVSKK